MINVLASIAICCALVFQSCQSEDFNIAIWCLFAKLAAWYSKTYILVMVLSPQSFLVRLKWLKGSGCTLDGEQWFQVWGGGWDMSTNGLLSHPTNIIKICCTKQTSSSSHYKLTYSVSLKYGVILNYLVCNCNQVIIDFKYTSCRSDYILN